MRHSLTRETLWTAIVTFTLCSFAFSERMNSIGIVLLAAHWLLDKNIYHKFKSIFSKKNTWPLFAFFGIYLVFYLFSDFDTSASHSIESKLTFLLLPLFLSTENYFQKNQKLIFQIFLISLSLSFIYALGNSYYVIIMVLKKTSFWLVLNRMHISMAIMHPGYYSNFFMLGIIYLIFNRVKGQYFFLSLCSIAVILLMSRIVLIFYVIFILTITLNYLRNTSQKLIKSFGLLLIGIMLGLIIYQVPTVQARIKESINNLNNASKDTKISSATATRRIAYEQEWELIKNKPLIGYGLGQANKTLRQRLKNTGYLELSKQMSTHNQYFSQWISMGLIGFIALILLLIFLFYYFRKNNLKTAWWFTLLVTLYLATDDMLDIQAGVVFFVLVWCLYLFKEKERISSL